MVQTRMKLVDNMDVMVAQVSAETKRRVEYEASRRPVFVDQAVQTHCGLGDMELLCAINEEPPPDEDPVDTHSRIMSVAKVQFSPYFAPAPPFSVLTQHIMSVTAEEIPARGTPRFPGDEPKCGESSVRSETEQGWRCAMG